MGYGGLHPVDVALQRGSVSTAYRWLPKSFLGCGKFVFRMENSSMCIFNDFGNESRLSLSHRQLDFEESGETRSWAIANSSRTAYEGLELQLVPLPR